MFILRPYIFSKFKELIFGFSTKPDQESQPPFNFNLSLSVGDEIIKVKENRKKFFTALRIDEERVAYQKQVHSDKITVVSHPGSQGESDAMITAETNLALAISTADCVPVFLYDNSAKVIAAVHSGWRGTHKKILMKTLLTLKTDFNLKTENITAYIGPSISMQNYEVGEQVASLFDNQVVNRREGRYFIDLKKANYHMLIEQGVPPSNIQCSGLCTFEMPCFLHSYRRDGKYSGRSLGVIAISRNDAGFKN